MREKLILWLFKHTQEAYLKFKDKKSWNMKKKELLAFPEDSFGNELGVFLNKNNFELLPKAERHDAYHLLTGYGTKIEDEIALQYVCLGNGKRSLYLLGGILVGVFLFPEHFNYYIKSYKLGKHSNQFYHFDYKKLLKYPLQELREMIFNKEQLSIIN